MAPEVQVHEICSVFVMSRVRRVTNVECNVIENYVGEAEKPDLQQR